MYKLNIKLYLLEANKKVFTSDYTSSVKHFEHMSSISKLFISRSKTENVAILYNGVYSVLMTTAL